MRPTIAIFEFLKIREPLFVFSFIGIRLAPMEYAKPEQNIHSVYVRFLQVAELHPPPSF